MSAPDAMPERLRFIGQAMLERTYSALIVNDFIAGRYPNVVKRHHDAEVRLDAIRRAMREDESAHT